MPRKPFAPVRRRLPGGMIAVGNRITDERPELAQLIGKCLMIWSPVEAEMALVLGQLLGAKHRAAMAVFHSLRRSSAQREAVTLAAESTLDAPGREIVAAVLAAHKSVEVERNALAHGHFGTYSKLSDAILWMNSSTYITIKADHELAAKRYEADDWGTVYDEMYYYEAADLQQIFDDFMWLTSVWNDLKQWLRHPDPDDARYSQLARQPRIAQALSNIRRENRQSAPP